MPSICLYNSLSNMCLYITKFFLFLCSTLSECWYPCVFYSYACDCSDTGYEGNHCEIDIPECLSDPCQHGGTCQEGVKEYTCLCWQGTDLQAPIQTFLSQTQEYKLWMPLMFTTLSNNTPICFCCCCCFCVFFNQTTMRYWNCLQKKSELHFTKSESCFFCVCLFFKYFQCVTHTFFFSLGYEGPNCEADIDECADQPCENNGECFERSDASHWELDWELSFADAAGYICQCQSGFAGQ